MNNDTMVVLNGASNPVLAHLFLNYLLDLPNVLNNISWNGYMQPLTGVTPQVLVKQQILDPPLTSTVVVPSTFKTGLFELQLPVDADDAPPGYSPRASLPLCGGAVSHLMCCI